MYGVKFHICAFLFYFIGKCFALPYKIKPSAILHTNLLRKFGALRTETGTFDEKYYYSVLRNVPFCSKKVLRVVIS